MTNATRILEMKASSAGMTPEQAAEFIRNCDQFRTFREKMERFASEGDLRSKLLAGLSMYHPDMQIASLDRKVHMWLNGQTDLSLDRKTIIELAFIFRLTTEQADSFLALMTDEGFRWRDPDEIISIFAMNHGMDYTEAEQLRQEIGIIETKADDASNNDENLTNLVRYEIMRLVTKEDLKVYLSENTDKFGKCRNRAWRLFMRYMDRLKSPILDDGIQMLIEDKHLRAEKDMTTFSVLKSYLHREMIPQGAQRNEIINDKSINKVQKAILSGILSAWPDENSLRKIEKRSMSVNRKTMILLFIALDEDPIEEDDDEFEITEDELARERFESRYSRLNLMLTNCGYRQLDARNPFDWMILYTISVDELYDSDGVLDELLSEMFLGTQK